LFFNNPKPATIYDLPNKLKVLPLSAVEGMKIVKDELLNLK
jgi:NAD-dependent deacetylase